MSPLRGGLVGCGHYARNHLAAWRDIADAEIVSVCDRDQNKAEAVASEFGPVSIYDDFSRMLQSETLDFVDIVTPPDSHPLLVEIAAANGIPTICQKPMAPDMAAARRMVDATSRAGVAFMIHENFRWRSSIRSVRRALDEAGPPFFARISFRSGHDVFAAQPYLAREPRFILDDLGVHLLDLARFLLGEMRWIACRTSHVRPDIAGEDAATVMLESAGGATCVVEASYASVPETELFPQVLIHVEGPKGTVALGPNQRITTVTGRGAVTRDHSVAPRLWAKPGFEATADSIVAIQEHWVRCLREGAVPETCGLDNLRSLALVHAAYDSAESGQAMFLDERSGEVRILPERTT